MEITSWEHDPLERQRVLSGACFFTCLPDLAGELQGVSLDPRQACEGFHTQISLFCLDGQAPWEATTPHWTRKSSLEKKTDGSTAWEGRAGRLEKKAKKQ